MNVETRKLSDWYVMQDVHDLGERLHLFEDQIDLLEYPHMMSAWEKVDRLTYLQKIYEDTPYFGRRLRYFNTSPWWYRSCFNIEEGMENSRIWIVFPGVDYHCKVWLNGRYLGEHKGYFDDFSFEISEVVKTGENVLYAKVWSYWDTEVDSGAESMRCFAVKRNMVKGTCEHGDGFIQRDVNPVGIIGNPLLKIKRKCFLEAVTVDNLLLEDGRGMIRIGGKITAVEKEEKDGKSKRSNYHVCIRLLGPDRELVSEKEVSGQDTWLEEMIVEMPRLWSTWDRGGSRLYELQVVLCDSVGEPVDSVCRRLGFKKVDLFRSTDETCFYLNGRPLFLRGTSYFPDVYVRDIPREKYRHDLILMREAGFNAIRVHVHVEQPVFYELCDEMGFLVFQDSDFSWNHPTTKEWIVDNLGIFDRMVERLKGYACLGCWILLNEPDKWKTLLDYFGSCLEEIIARTDSITEIIGRQLTERIKRLDPVHPYIRASYDEEDLESGDSHNYLGSLRSQQSNYTDIEGTTEKFNTEYGMDAPGALANLYRIRPFYEALLPVEERMDEIQGYQSRLLKYYTEHYRRQRFAPCSAYFQFMFIDLCPQSFYGILDWWGIPKASYQVLQEINQPVAVLAYPHEGQISVMLVNDTDQKKTGIIRFMISQNGLLYKQGELEAEVPADSSVAAGSIPSFGPFSQDKDLELLFLAKDGTVIAGNHYQGAFCEWQHIAGHPVPVDNELGMRIFR